MVNRKGFTLVELLAVIVILGLILGIVFPSISRYIGEAKDTTYDLHEADMKTAASNMMTECVKDGKECAPDTGKSKKLTLKDLVDNDYTEKLRDPENPDEFCDIEKSHVIVKNTSGDSTQLDYDVCLVCGSYKSEACEASNNNPASCDKENDKKPPVCGTVTGQSTLWTNKDRVISVTCSDDDCGCKQETYYKKFTESDKVKKGKGIITVEDEAGNQAECEVNVYVDKEKPTCTLSVEGSLGKQGWYGGRNVRVVLSTTQDDLSGVSTYGIGTSSKNYNFDKSSSYVVQPGITTVYGYVKDNAGNIGTCSIEVKYDPVLPTVDEVRYGIQVYEKEDIASVSGNTISLNSITSEYGNIYGAMVYLEKEHSGSVTKIIDGSTTLGTRTISEGVEKMEFSFPTPKTYKNLNIDLGTIEPSQVKKIELLTDTTNTTSYFTNKDVTVYIISSDSLSGVSKYSFDNGKSFQYENYKTYAQNQNVGPAVQDVAGNISRTKTEKINNIDKIKPNCTITLNGLMGSDNWYIGNVGVVLDTSDATATTTNAMSGIRNYDLTLSNKASYSGKKSGTQTADTTGTTWYGYVRDRAGNTNTCEIVIKKDTVPPTCKILDSGTMGNNGWYKSDVTLAISPSDVTSGVVAYDVTTSASATYRNVSKVTQKNDTTGITYYGYVKDNAGLIGTCSIKGIKKDSTPPTCTLSISAGSKSTYNGYYLDTATFSMTTYDATSLIASSNKPTLTEGKNVSFTGTVTDKAGNTGSCSATYSVDLCSNVTSHGGCSGTCPSCGENVSLSCGYSNIGISGYTCSTGSYKQNCNIPSCSSTEPDLPDCPCGNNCCVGDTCRICPPTEGTSQETDDEEICDPCSQTCCDDENGCLVCVPSEGATTGEESEDCWYDSIAGKWVGPNC